MEYASPSAHDASKAIHNQSKYHKIFGQLPKGLCNPVQARRLLLVRTILDQPDFLRILLFGCVYQGLRVGDDLMWSCQVSIQFQLLTTTILFLSREGFRRGCLRAKSGDANKSNHAELRRVSGISILPVLVGAFLCPLSCCFVINWAKGANGHTYETAVWLHGGFRLSMSGFND